MKKSTIIIVTLLTSYFAGTIAEKEMDKHDVDPMTKYATCTSIGFIIGLIGRAIVKGGEK